MKHTKDISRCRSEIARCRRHLHNISRGTDANDPHHGKADAFGAGLGLQDWFSELLILNGEWQMADPIIRPAGSRILVERDGFEYKGTLVIPDSAKRSGTTGMVVAIGSAVEPSFCNIGDRVVYGNYAGTPIKFDNGPDYLILSPDEVLGFLPTGCEAKVTAAGSY